MAPLPLIIAATPLAIVNAVLPRAANPEDLFPFFSKAITDILSPPYICLFYCYPYVQHTNHDFSIAVISAK
jgi:hypothetical protein